VGEGITVSGNANVLVTVPGMIDTVSNLGNISGSFTPNRALSSVQHATLTGNITLNPVDNIASGQSFTLILRQDSEGVRRMTPNSAYKFAGNFKILSTIANSVDMLNMFYDGTTYYVTLTTGYQ
jgi:hypothetical protein